MIRSHLICGHATVCAVYGLTGYVIYYPALALVDVLGIFTSEIGFCTPKIRRSAVL